MLLNYDPSRNLFGRMTELRAGILTDVGSIPNKVRYATLFRLVQTASDTHPVLYSVGTWVFTRRKDGGARK